MSQPHSRTQTAPQKLRIAKDPGGFPKFEVSPKEGWEVFSRFVDATLANAAIQRVHTYEGLPVVSSKLMPAFLFLVRHSDEPMTVGDLAEGIGASIGWASRVTAELAAAGILGRIRDDLDRRRVWVQVTKQAEVIGRQPWKEPESAIKAALSEIAPGERLVIVRFLQRLTEELKLHGSKDSPRHESESVLPDNFASSGRAASRR